MNGENEYTHPKFNAEVDMENPVFKLGMCFSNAEEFRKAVRNHAIKNGRKVRFVKNTPNKLRAVCSNGCDWLIYDSKVQREHTLQVKTFNSIHTCNRALHVPQISTKWLANKYCDRLRNNPTWPGASMKKTMESENVLKLSRTMVYRARATAMSMITGNEEEQFWMLRSYCQALLDANPGSTCIIKTEQYQDQYKFKAVYICLDALRRGFVEGCRRFVGFDGCHLSSGYRGILLAAVGIDGNNQMYPFAWAVVGQETYKTWHWFISLIIEDLGITDPENSKYWTFLCDKQKGLVQALANLMPEVEHRFCLRHLYENFKLHHRGVELKKLLWKAAMATRVCDFDLAMEELKAINKKAYEWLSQRPPVQWSKSYFRTSSKCDISLNNWCESFNKSIIDARDKPIITMLEAIRVQLMERIHKQRDGMAKYTGMICPNIQKILDLQKQFSASWIPSWNGEDEFELSGPYGDKRVVNIRHRSCSCRRWDISGISCCHAVAALIYMREDPEKWVHTSFSKETFMQTYSHVVHVVDSMDTWPAREPLLPPDVPKQVGRKKKQRTKSVNETTDKNLKTRKKKVVQEPEGTKLKRQNTTITCGKCGGIGHNRYHCNNPSIVSMTAATTTVASASSAPLAPLESQPEIVEFLASTFGNISSLSTSIGRTKMQVKRRM
ncbi:hypothetical protein EUGRSUZ_B01037 [Eucalyptus grandis]|uniref:Uncharacterized protein n=2 Tax=Eucalyptus grandis TaxID=71139 RepID=A0ACC3LPM2_EUCGR|nr:hypothetical protein EUGRSUZ_B01037 [Eucalyptus grandis]